MFYTIDRIYKDEKIVVLIGDNGNKIDIPIDKVNTMDVNIKEGLILKLTDIGYEPDYVQTKEVKDSIEKKFKTLFKN